MRPPKWVLIVALIVTAASKAPAGEERVSFTTDVQPILTKQGCNQGACHGTQHGKGSFKLSLRGFDDAADHREIVRTAFGRRISLSDPQASLLLQKPTLGLSHEGGRRLSKDSWAYQTLVRWLRQGASGPAPTDRKLKELVIEPKELILQPGGIARISAKAVYEDGSVESLTDKAAFDSQSPMVPGHSRWSREGGGGPWRSDGDDPLSLLGCRHKSHRSVWRRHVAR